jgi:hypothetical protein
MAASRGEEESAASRLSPPRVDSLAEPSLSPRGLAAEFSARDYQATTTCARSRLHSRDRCYRRGSHRRCASGLLHLAPRRPPQAATPDLAPRAAFRQTLLVLVRLIRAHVDGAVAVSCRPASGSRLKIGRTNVTCSAADKTGNTATARFTLTVERKRSPSWSRSGRCRRGR